MLSDVARVLKSLPGALEKHTVLGIEDCRVAWAHAEERRIEPGDVVEASTRLYVCRVAQALERLAGREELLVRKKGDRFDTRPEVRPEGSRVRSARKPPGQSNDGECRGGIVLPGHRRRIVMCTCGLACFEQLTQDRPDGSSSVLGAR